MNLYHLYELHRVAMGPLNLMAEATRATLQHPMVPASYTKMGRAIAAGAELIERTTRYYKKPEFGLTHTVVDGQKVEVVEEVLGEKPFCRLIHFARDLPPGRPRDPQILVVAPMSGHHATLLRGTVEALLPEHDVFITDWLDARTVPLSAGDFGLDDYVDYLIDFMRGLGPETNVIAVCQPAVPVLCAVSLMAAADDPAQPRSMALMGGPIDVRQAPTEVTEFGAKHSIEWFKRNVISQVPPSYPGAFRKVYPGFIQLAGFMSMNVGNHVKEHMNLFKHLIRGDGDNAERHRKFYDEYLAVLDIPARFYLDTVEHVFQKASLPRGELMIRGKLVDPSKIKRTALFTIEGEFDDISAPGQTKAAHDLCSNLPAHMREHHLQEGVGHYGIFNGRKWREVIMPKVRHFIREFDRPAKLGPITKRAKAEPLPHTVGKGNKRLALKSKVTAKATKAAKPTKAAAPKTAAAKVAKRPSKTAKPAAASKRKA